MQEVATAVGDADRRVPVRRGEEVAGVGEEGVGEVGVEDDGVDGARLLAEGLLPRAAPHVGEDEDRQLVGLLLKAGQERVIDEMLERSRAAAPRRERERL